MAELINSKQRLISVTDFETFCQIIILTQKWPENFHIDSQDCGAHIQS